jgi:hypothetical protein
MTTTTADERTQTWTAEQLTDLHPYAVFAVGSRMAEHKMEGTDPTDDHDSFVKVCGHRAWSTATQNGVDTSWARATAACYWALEHAQDDVASVARKILVRQSETMQAWAHEMGARDS